jgi:membrane-bound lytic murein transglycosylase A
MLASCTTSSPPAAPAHASPQIADDDRAPLPPPLQQPKSRWTPVRWAELPGFAGDTLFDAWNAWLKSCERPGPVFAPLCGEVRR